MERAMIAIEAILTNLDRHEGGMGDIDSLSLSMSRNGLINPITVVQINGEAPDSGEYEILAGRRRLEAAKALGWTHIPASIYSLGEAREEEVQLAENVNRLDMHPLDEGALYKRLLDTGTPLTEISNLAGKSKSAVYQRVELLRLTQPMKELFRSGSLNLTQASMIGGLSEEAQSKIEEYFGSVTNGPIQSWTFSQAIRRFGGTDLSLCSFEKCATCTARTRYSDQTLFPEITDEADRCFDRECFEKQYAFLVVSQIEEIYAKNKVPLSDINDPPVIIEDSGIGILFSPGAHLTIQGVRFPVISEDNTILIHDGSGLLERYAETIEEKIKTGLYISGDPRVSVGIQRYITSEDYQSIVNAEQPEEDLLSAAVMPLESDREKDAYREVVKDMYDIEEAARQSVLKSLALSLFSVELPAPVLLQYLKTIFGKNALVFTVQAHDQSLEDSTILDESRWIEDKPFDWIKAVVFDLIIYSLVTKRYFSLDSDMSEEQKQFFIQIGTGPEEVLEKCKESVRAEIIRRVNFRLGEDCESESGDEDETEDEQESAEASTGNDTFPGEQ